MSEAELVGLLREHATKCSVPGAAIGILRDGVLKTEHYGIADVTTGEPVTPETRFAVGSLCKTMVATAIARLAEAGRFSLDDPAAAHVPELEGVQWAERASIRDLLANRAGCPLCAELEFTDSEDDDDAVLARFASERRGEGADRQVLVVHECRLVSARARAGDRRRARLGRRDARISPRSARV